MSEYYEHAVQSAQYIQSRCALVPETGLILGSGLGALSEGMKDAVMIPYSKIPWFPKSSLAGHADCLILGSAIFIRDPLSVGLSILGALALNLVIAVNHKAGRYMGT